jgi:methylenetetrahydrofolate dehydrogenase (NADP+)/methenyltetrahydrofolate cyclohydrolase
MSARIIDGTKISSQIRDEVKNQVTQLKQAGITPGLAAVLVGENPASQVYVRNKVRTCEGLGIYSEMLQLPQETTTAQLLTIVHEFNAKDQIDGILVQLPLPKHIDEQAILLAIDPDKDVDGLHPLNVGNLVLGQKGLRPCTPSGVIEILRRENIPLKGSHAVIIGRSNLVGKPLAFLLLQEHATVTLCHSRTRNLAMVARQADILIAAIGKPAMITAEYVNPGAVVIDVGINKIVSGAVPPFLEADPSLRPQYEKNKTQGRDYVLAGDVNFSSAAQVASAITPVPGGVGPLTIAMLMSNTVQAAKMRRAGI